MGRMENSRMEDVEYLSYLEIESAEIWSRIIVNS